MSADSTRRHHQQHQQQQQQQHQHHLQQQQHQHHHHYHLHHHHQHHSSSSGAGGVVVVGAGGGASSSSISSSTMGLRGGMAMPAIVPPQSVSDRSILDSAIGFINDVTLVHQPQQDPKDTITWARFETCADVSDPRFGDDWELEGNAAPPLLLILGYGLGAQVWAIPANGEAVEVLSWLHGVVTALRILPTPTMSASALDDTGRADEPVDAFAEKRPLVAIVDGGSAAGGVGAGAAGGIGGGSGSAGHSSGTTGMGIGNPNYSHPSSNAPHFSAVNFVSLKTGAQVKTIKFKNPVLDIQANRSSVVISFHERLAVFDARTLEDRLTITTCFPSPGINPNPIALGPRWLAYAENKLLHSKRSGGGCDGEGVPSYTATVLNAAKSFSKGLLELGGQMAAGLTGTTAGSGNSSKSSSFDSATGGADAKHPGVVTIIDVKHPLKDYSPTSGVLPAGGGPIIAHFVAHSEAIVAMEFDSSGMLLLTADRRGHDFHVFRIQPHPVGSSLAAVHHLYVLHRGDTSAKVQHIAFSLDSRWAAVSTLRGTTHVFPITPYGGAMGVRTHTSLHVVNKLSRFHRSAGLGADGRSSSPISHSESTTFVQSLQPYHNPTLPPFPRPVVVQPLAQLRQPLMLGSPPGSASLGGVGSVGGGGHVGHVGGAHGGVGIGVGVSSHQRQRLSSLSDDSGKPLSVCATFAKPRSWLLEPATATREAPHRVQRKAVDSLFVMAGHGALIQYDLDTKLASNVAKEKICDDTPIELEVEAKAQWNLGRRKDGSHEIIPPLALDNWLIKDRHASQLMDSANQFDEADERADSWLAQVEIITHAGPHRRLWMGPQFVFKNYNTPSGSNLNLMDAEAVEIGVTKTTTTALPSSTVGGGPAAASLTSAGGAIIATVERSSPLNMPLGAPIGATAAVSTAGRSGVPVLIESGSYSSIEQSPKLMDRFRHGHLDSDYGHGDMRLKEDLADAMRESPSTAAARRDPATTCYESATVAATTAAALAAAAAATSTATLTSCDNTCFYDALAEHDAELDLEAAASSSSAASTMSTLASVLPNICSYETQPPPPAAVRVEKMVNPLGTVTDVHAGISGELQTDMLDEVVGQLAAEDLVIHENCDEALFRPVVAIFCNELVEQRKHEEAQAAAAAAAAAAGGGGAGTAAGQARTGSAGGDNKAPVVLGNKLIVPVIAKEVDEVIVQKEKQLKKKSLKSQAAAEDAAQALRFAQLSHLNKPSKAVVSEDETTPGEEDVMQTSISSTMSGGKMSNKKAKAAKHKAKQSNKKDNGNNKQKQQQQVKEQELEREREREREKEQEREREQEKEKEQERLREQEKEQERLKEQEKEQERLREQEKQLERERELELERKRQQELEKELQLEKRKQEQDRKREKEQEQKREQKKEQERELKKEQERELKKEEELRKKREQEQQKNRKQKRELEVEVEADPADSLLANKEIIASVMMSSASAQGLSLHVQQEEEEEEAEQEKQAEEEVTKPQAKPKSPSSAWKSIETASSIDFPSLSLASATSTPRRKCEKLLPELQTPQKQEDDEEEQQQHEPKPATQLKPLKQLNFNDFLMSSLPPLDMCPVLPPLEPLPALDDDEPQIDSDTEQLPSPPAPTTTSLINFESPVQETAAPADEMLRKITPPPRGFTEQNLILALCGSLHLEEEQAAAATTTTATLRDAQIHKSNNSSGSEELLLLPEEEQEQPAAGKKQLSKKHKRASKQQQQQQDEDEELRPLISVSVCEQLHGEEEEEEHSPVDEEEDEEYVERNRSLPVEDLLHFAGASTTSTSADDSEGPMPATTSDDVATVAPAPIGGATPQHKLKTKKIEHKINLIAAIEAATSSSSTSSAEESSVEAAATTTVAGGAATSTVSTAATSLAAAAAAAGNTARIAAAAATVAGGGGGGSCVGVAMSSSSQPSGQKKKTKRRKR